MCGGGECVCVWGGVSVCVQWLSYHRKLFLNTLGFLYTEYVWVFPCNVLQTTILYTVYKMRWLIIVIHGGNDTFIHALIPFTFHELNLLVHNLSTCDQYQLITQLECIPPVFSLS